MTFVNEKEGEKYKTIDRCRDIVLYRSGHTGGSSAMLDSFELHMEGEIVSFIDKPSFAKNKIHHELTYLKIPESLKARQNEVIGYISEALDVFGAYWNKNADDVVTVSFSTTRKIAQGI